MHYAVSRIVLVVLEGKEENVIIEDGQKWTGAGIYGLVYLS